MEKYRAAADIANGELIPLLSMCMFDEAQLFFRVSQACCRAHCGRDVGPYALQAWRRSDDGLCEFLSFPPSHMSPVAKVNFSPPRQAADVYNKHAIEKGIAFPTSICVNDQVQYNSPLPEDDVLLNQGDVVKM